MLLILVIIGMLYFWKPWDAPASARTITVQGEAVVKATPETFEFQPVFENADAKVATAAGNEAVTQLKKLGVKDIDIKTQASVSSIGTQPQLGIKSTIYPPVPVSTTSIYTITAVARDKVLAQKVSDYLATTTATGQITPTTSFSKDTEAKLLLEARSKASDDAKSKAIVTAKQLGAKVGRVSKISDDNGPGMYPVGIPSADSAKSYAQSNIGAAVQPGLNQISYSLTVVFELQ